MYQPNISDVLDMRDDDLTGVVDIERRFAGVGRAYGEAAYARFQQAHVVVVGLGGVGSWVAEALARTAVGHVTLIDMDVVAESNVNRQLTALSSTLGHNKIDVVAERIRHINPLAQVNTIDDFLSEENVEVLLPRVVDTAPYAVIDCVDDVRAKIAMIRHSHVHRYPLITVGSAGGKLNPLSIKVADLAFTTQDPLLAKVRQRLRKYHGLGKITSKKTPKMGVRCVYSDEAVKMPEVCSTGGLQCGGYGSSMVMTNAMAMVAVAECLAQFKRDF